MLEHADDRIGRTGRVLGYCFSLALSSTILYLIIGLTRHLDGPWIYAQAAIVVLLVIGLGKLIQRGIDR